MTNQPNFMIRSLADELRQQIRQNRVDRFGNTLTILRDGKHHQCRVCLTLSQPDEGVILFAHQPFDSKQPYAETGPIFIHERDCLPYQNAEVYPPEFPRSAVVLRAYNEKDQIVGATAVGERLVEEVIAELFADSVIAYLHARNLGYGCYMFRIERR